MCSFGHHLHVQPCLNCDVRRSAYCVSMGERSGAGFWAWRRFFILPERGRKREREREKWEGAWGGVLVCVSWRQVYQFRSPAAVSHSQNPEVLQRRISRNPQFRSPTVSQSCTPQSAILAIPRYAGPRSGCRTVLQSSVNPPVQQSVNPSAPQFLGEHMLFFNCFDVIRVWSCVCVRPCMKVCV